MTQRPDIDRLHRGPDSTPRLRLQRRSSRGFIDGAWWSRRDDLSAELPDQLVRGGEMAPDADLCHV